MTMPFSPCDPNAASCDDVSVSILNRIFGDAIMQMATGADPDAIAAATNTFASMIDVFNTGILTVAGIIVSYVALVGSVNTANDGEAFGKHWSTVWTPLRIVAGGGSLLPSASGYSFIQKIIFLFALWAIGFANAIYEKGIQVGIVGGSLTSISNEIGMGATATPNPDFPLYDLRKFGTDYLAVAWCQKTVNSIYAAGIADGTEVPDIGADTVPVEKQESETKKSSTVSFRDQNQNSNLGGGKAICGSIKFYDYDPAANLTINPAPGSIFDPSTINNNRAAMQALRIAALSAKVNAANQLMSDLNDWVQTWPSDIVVTDPSATQWNTVSADKFNQIVNSAQSKLITDLTNQISSDTTLKSIMQQFTTDVTKDGWAMAGGFYQRLGGIREEMSKIYSESVAEVGSPDLSSLPNDALGNAARNSNETAFNTIISKSLDGASYDNTKVGIVACFKAIFSFTPDSGISIDSMGSRGHSCMSNYVGQIMQGIIDTAVGTDGHTDAIARIKTIGDSMRLAQSLMSATVAGIKTTLKATEAGAATAATVQVLGNKIDLVPLIKAVEDLFDQIFGDPIVEIAKWFSNLAFWFGIFVPTLPYFVFMMAVVGWLLSVLQAVVAAPLWAVMHMTPDRTFVGSQSQGYLLMVSLFARPALIVIGLFAAFNTANPIIDYVSKFFWATRSANVTSAESLGWFIEFLTIRDWLVMYGMVITPIVYMIFGLSQVLPDTVLSWIGAGIRSLGETQATSEMRSSMQRHTPVNPGGGGSSPRLGHNNNAERQQPLPGSNPEGGGSGGGANSSYGTGSSSRARRSSTRAATGYGRGASARNATQLVNANPGGVSPPTTAPESSPPPSRPSRGSGGGRQTAQSAPGGSSSSAANNRAAKAASTAEILSASAGAIYGNDSLEMGYSSAYTNNNIAGNSPEILSSADAPNRDDLQPA